jgi:pyruvate/2-oxoglutarate dehydrogenase complex dihydrolipoamide dehydrogenase (E3) component
LTIPEEQPMNDTARTHPGAGDADEITDQITTVDAVVMGLGPGGEIVASQLAKAGLSVVGVEAALVGGECPFWACVPSKMMVRAAELIAETRRVPALSGTSNVDPDWTPVATRIRDEATDDWDDTEAARRLEETGCTIVRGRGRLVAPDTVEVHMADGGTGGGGARRCFRGTRAVVIATGTRPAVPPIDGLADTPYWTNHEATETDRLPASIIVLGGGPVGAELAQVYARFGADVTVVESADRLLPREEPRAGEILGEVFAGEGIEVLTGVSATQVSHDGHSFTMTLDDHRAISAERLLVATGRDTRLDDIGVVDALGIDPEATALPVDDHLRVADGVWAVGDVTGQGAFTHVALHQAKIVLADILGEESSRASDAAVPRVTFTDPEVGSVGLTVDAATEAGVDVMVGHTSMPSTARGWMHGPGNEGFIQLVADRERNVLVGATAMGPSGGEVLGLLTLAVHAEIPLEQLRTMIYAYPTFHRGVEDALRDMDSS